MNIMIHNFKFKLVDYVFIIYFYIYKPMRLLCLRGDIKNSKENNQFDDEKFFFIQLEILTFIKNKKMLSFL